MSDAEIVFSLDNEQATYQPGETLSGHYRLLGVGTPDVQAVELSVMWYTEGKGDEDLAVHFFDRAEPGNVAYIDLSQPRYFSTRLPNSPLSYAGVIVKICWCARLRVYLSQGKQLFEQRPFQLGHVAEPAETVS